MREAHSNGEATPRGDFWLWLSERAGTARGTRSVDLVRVLPFFGMHLACLGVVWTGWSPTALAVALALYLLRMFAITGFYHRYFSHRSFRTSRAAQLVFAVLGASAAQRGPLWWAAHHRTHHARSDSPEDVHSPGQHGFWWSHVGWFLSRHHYQADADRVRDLARYPELRWLDENDFVAPLALAVLLFACGELLARHTPGLGTDGWQLLAWGFFVSTVALYHGTYTINSLAHRFGRRRFETGDDSRNSFWLALLTLGEGWHNNHHHYPAAARQGFYWWEVDLTWYGLKALAALGLIWDLKPVPELVLGERRIAP